MYLCKYKTNHYNMLLPLIKSPVISLKRIQNDQNRSDIKKKLDLTY